MGKVMEFFEELKQAAHNKFKGDPFPPYSDGYLFGVAATVEALKEMMVGEPMKAIMEPEIVQDTESSRFSETTWIVSSSPQMEIGMSGLHGTDGEEVYVVVVRSGGKSA